MSVAAVQQRPTTNNSILKVEKKEVLYRDFLLSQLTPYITQAITKYYGEPKSYDLYNSKVLKIKRLKEGSYYFEITVQVITYEGAHNPPNGLETITITQDNKGIYVTYFNHEESSRREN